MYCMYQYSNYPMDGGGCKEESKELGFSNKLHAFLYFVCPIVF